MKFLRWYTPKFKTELEPLLETIQAGITAGEVDRKQVRRLQALINKANLQKHFPKYQSGNWNEIDSFIDGSFYIYLYPGERQVEARKHLKKANAEQQKFLNLIIEMCEEFKVPHTLLKQAQDLLEQSKNSYTPARASNPVLQQIHKLLVQVIEDTHAQLLVRWGRIVEDLVKSFEQRQDQSQSLYDFYGENPWAKDIVGRLVARKDGRSSNPYVRVKNFRDQKQKIVTEEVARIESAFLQKNLAKISPIVEKRKDFTQVELVAAQVSSGNLEGTLAVKFAAVEFLVKSQVVWSTSILGTHFVRYPTTFHQVKTKQGVIAKASEEYMNEKLPK